MIQFSLVIWPSNNQLFCTIKWPAKEQQKIMKVQSNLLVWSPLLRDLLLKEATFSGSLGPKYNANEPVLRGHLS